VAILTIISTCFCAGELLAQQPTSAQLISGSTTIKLQVIESQTIQLGNQITTFNLVVPPVFPTPTPAAVPAPTPPLSPAYLQWLQAEDQKTYKIIFLSATIYDHNVTDVRFSDQTGSCRVFSDINFAYLSGACEFETPDTIYEYMGAWGDETTSTLYENLSAWPAAMQANQVTLKWVTKARQQLPNLAISPGSRSGYLVAEAPVAGSDVLSVLNDLHAYYDANHVQLIAAYQQRIASQAAAQAWAAAHPPGPPPPVVINMWPIKNSRYLNTGTTTMGTVTTGTGGNNQ